MFKNIKIVFIYSFYIFLSEIIYIFALDGNLSSVQIVIVSLSEKQLFLVIPKEIRL